MCRRGFPDTALLGLSPTPRRGFPDSASGVPRHLVEVSLMQRRGFSGTASRWPRRCVGVPLTLRRGWGAEASRKYQEEGEDFPGAKVGAMWGRTDAVLWCQGNMSPAELQADTMRYIIKKSAASRKVGPAPGVTPLSR